MTDRHERGDVPAEPGTRLPEQFAGPRDDLRQRLDRLSGGHPASDHYRAGDHGPPDTAETATRTDTRRETATRADIHVETATRADTHRDAPEQAGSGWRAPDVRDHPDRPAESDIHLPADRGRHILDGDGGGSPGGGHRHGTGRPGKTEFPATWPDEVILPLVEEITRAPDTVEWQRNGRWLVTAERYEVRVTAVLQADGRIWAAWPQPGGAGVMQNPKEVQA